MATMLYHFSDDADIKVFEPRVPRVVPDRPKGQEWLNDPLVWAIAETFCPLYLFPRECPRIVMWRRPETTADDVDRYFHNGSARMVAYVELAWMDRIKQGRVTRYQLPHETFVDLNDAGMFVSRKAVRPLDQVVLADLAAELAARQVELRAIPNLSVLNKAWDSSLQVSGIRLRNAASWSV